MFNVKNKYIHSMVVRRIFYLIFLLVLACSKDKDEDPQYVVKNYDVSIETTEGGTVSYAGGSIQAGQTVTVNASPSDGYKFTGWSGDATGNENPLTVTVYSNTNITANFERIKYVLNVGVVGSGQVSQTIISSSKKGEEYNAGTVIRLNANSNSGSLFTTWSGSTTETSSEIDITIDGTKSVTATFEEQIFNLVNQDNVFIGTGRWKIRKPKTGDRGSGKLNHCEITELIFRKDGTFTIVFTDLTVAGIYRVSQSQTSSFSIDLSVARNNYGKIDNLTLTNNYISFSIVSSDCDKSVQADKDKDYDESKDPLACKIEGNLLSGPQTQVVSATQSIAEVKYEFSTNCPQLINSSVSNLPPGVTMSFVDNIATISGAPTSQASGVYNYLISLDNALSATATDPAAPASAQFSIEGTIEVTSSVTQTSCSQASITLVDGNPNQSIIIGESIGTIVWELSTDCPPDSNGVPLNSSASGLPQGVTYSFSGQNNRIFVQGTPSSVGTYSYNIIYYNEQQLSSSSVVASVTGVITVAASSTTTSTSCSADPCTISGALVSGAQSLTTTVSTDSVLVRYDFTNTCSQVIQASVSGLPPGVTYIVQEVSPSLAYVQLRGIPTSVGNYNYTINVDNSLIATASAPACAATASTTITGSISVVASSTAATSCTQASISLVSGNPNQAITLGSAVGNVTWGLSTDCPPDGNGVPLNSSASGLPPGVNYSFSGQNQQILLSGTPSSVGTYSYNIVYYNGQQLSGSSVTASVTGIIAISAVPSCTISSSVLSGSTSQVVNAGSPITNIVYQLNSSNCAGSFTSINATGLPPGVSASLDSSNDRITLNGSPSNQTSGTYNYSISFENSNNGSPVSSSVSGSITVNPVCTVSGSITSGNADQTIAEGQSITDIIASFSSSCSYPLTANASGLPSGVTATFSGNNQLLIAGTPNSGAGTFTYQIAIYDNPPAGQVSSSITVGGTIAINPSTTSSSTNATQTWSINVTAQNSANYQLSGNDRNGTVTGNDPTVTIALGDTLNFAVDAPGHPFYLKTQSGTGTANQVSGATNQGTENGTVTWTPSATGTYYYICSLHGGMVGTIIVQ
ncbi:MAG: hypothetical protein CBC56_008315 [Flavobacteriales bacterium TMED96]|nr:MAG: hypothetical protein CBC56_008315 [Flavobacteriales bacterium TMED96]